MASNKTGPSLAEFAAARTRKRCYVCDDIPDALRAEIERTRPQVSLRDICDWLEQVHGVKDVTRHKLERHWQEKHVTYGDES